MPQRSALSGRHRTHGLVPRGGWQPHVQLAEPHCGWRLGMTRNLRLIQFRQADGTRAVGLVTEDGRRAHPLNGFDTVYRLAQAAIDQGRPLAALIEAAVTEKTVDYLALLKEGRVLA